MCYSSRTALRGIAELDQAEAVYLAATGSTDPEIMAAGMRLFGQHLADWSHSFACAAALDLMAEREAMPHTSAQRAQGC